MNKKPVIAMDLSSTGLGGGPNISSSRVMNSDLRFKYDFVSFTYKSELGRGISIKRIIDIRNQLKQLKPDIVLFLVCNFLAFILFWHVNLLALNEQL